jgi:hypothetical protein
MKHNRLAVATALHNRGMSPSILMTPYEDEMFCSDLEGKLAPPHSVALINVGSLVYLTQSDHLAFVNRHDYQQQQQQQQKQGPGDQLRDYEDRTIRRPPIDVPSSVPTTPNPPNPSNPSKGGNN